MKINYLAVIVAAVVHFIIGGLWYGVIFGNTFLSIVQWTPEQIRQIQEQAHWSQYAAAFASSLVLVYVLAHVIKYMRVTDIAGGLQTAFWLWLGFVTTTQLATVIFEQRKFGLYLLNVGYQLVACLICSVILTAWKTREARDAVAEAA